MKSLRKWPLRRMLALALCLSAPLFSGRAQNPPGPDSNDVVFRRISNRLICQCGCNYMVLSCNMLDCPSATEIRGVIRKSLAAGQSEEVILASFVEQVGPKILAEPPREGFFWMGWIMPFLALALGGSLVSYVLWKWMTGRTAPAEAPQPAAAAPAVSAAVVEKYRAQIDRELEKD
jgi:cytochrome c-type biogenesis protein CcmH